MKRLFGLLLLSCAGLSLAPATASAQFGRPFGVGGFGPPATGFMPARNAFSFVPRYTWGTSYAVMGPPAIYGGLGASFTQRYTSVNNPRWAYAANYLNYVPYYSQTGSYMTASPNTRSDLLMVEQRTLQNAQREAGLPGAKAEINGGWNYERGEPGPSPIGAAHPAPVRVTPVDRALIASGEALNGLLKDITAAEAKGAKGPSGYIPPLLWEDLRFGGSPAGDLLNFTRQAVSLELPAAFDDPALAGARAEFEKDFAVVAVAVQAGKAPEAAKVVKLEASFRRFQDGAGPVVKDLPFEEASSARRFLNRMASALKALKVGGSVAGLIDPRWSTEGLTVADLTKHMARHKLQFAAAPPGSGEAYTTMHQHLATYLAVLTQPKK